jgi:hypothetical protein
VLTSVGEIVRLEITALVLAFWFNPPAIDLLIPFVTKYELSWVGSYSKSTEVIQTDASFGISFEMEVA